MGMVGVESNVHQDHEFLLAALARNGDTLRYVDEPWILDLTPRISWRFLLQDF